jgi:mannose-6-phosphate isomerase-like protein (cupin superfamily)
MKNLIVDEKNLIEIPDICGKVIELFNKENSACKNMSIATVFIDPGKESKKHFHKVMEEIYYIIKGEGEISIDNNKFLINEGYSVLLSPMSIHQIKNIGESVLKFISIDSPPFYETDVYFSD